MEYIIGVLASLLAQVTKKYFKTDSVGTQIIVVSVSFLLAALWVIYQDTALWKSFLQVLITAGAVHNFVIRKFE